MRSVDLKQKGQRNQAHVNGGSPMRVGYGQVMVMWHALFELKSLCLAGAHDMWNIYM